MIRQQENFNNQQSEHVDIWELILMGKFQMANDLAQMEFDNSHDVLPLRNKVYALLHLRKYEEVVQLTNKLIETTNGEVDSDFISCGIAHWALGKKEEAITCWRQSQKSKYTDAAGGIEVKVILYFASIKEDLKQLKNEMIKDIRKLIRPKVAVLNWPGPIGNYVLGEMSDNELLSRVATVPVLRERNLSQAYFAMAIKKLEEKNLDDYRAWLKKVIEFGPTVYLEHFFYIAKIELEDIF